MKTFKPYVMEDHLTPLQLEAHKAKIKFRKQIDRMYEDKYPPTNFCLCTSNLYIKEAYEKMVRNPNSDFK